MGKVLIMAKMFHALDFSLYVILIASTKCSTFAHDTHYIYIYIYIYVWVCVYIYIYISLFNSRNLRFVPQQYIFSINYYTTMCYQY